MSLPAISVHNLGKMYRLAHQGKRTNSFREAITSTVLAPFRRIRQLRGTDDTMEEFWALKDVSFDVQPGEVVGIIGRNGAGKSTLLKILSRIVEPTEGEIRLRGRVASLLEVGTGFHPELSGRENIFLNGSILGMKRREIDSKFDEIVDFAEVEKFLDTPVKRYSSGMYVRLAFAVAAHLDPEILIVDEVLAVGDAEFQKKCLGKMKEVTNGTGRTVFFVSHNMAAVQSLCTRAMILRKGRMSFLGDVESATNEYFASSSSNAQLVAQECKYAIVKNVAFVGEDNTALQTFRSCKLCVDMDLKQTLADIGVHVSIKDDRGVIICALDSRWLSAKISGQAGDSLTVFFDIDDLPLLPGSYLMHINIRDDLKFKSDHLPDSYPFEVAETPVYGSNKLPKNAFGMIGLKARISKSVLDHSTSTQFTSGSSME
jgi:lipopolysaccharide transport system ATP-binding protein